MTDDVIHSYSLDELKVPYFAIPGRFAAGMPRQFAQHTGKTEVTQGQTTQVERNDRNSLTNGG